MLLRQEVSQCNTQIKFLFYSSPFFSNNLTITGTDFSSTSSLFPGRLLSFKKKIADAIRARNLKSAATPAPQPTTLVSKVSVQARSSGRKLMAKARKIENSVFAISTILSNLQPEPPMVHGPRDSGAHMALTETHHIPNNRGWKK